jgi:hypothetical protein
LQLILLTEPILKSFGSLFQSWYSLLCVSENFICLLVVVLLNVDTCENARYHELFDRIFLLQRGFEVGLDLIPDWLGICFGLNCVGKKWNSTMVFVCWDCLIVMGVIGNLLTAVEMKRHRFYGRIKRIGQKWNSNSNCQILYFLYFLFEKLELKISLMHIQSCLFIWIDQFFYECQSVQIDYWWKGKVNHSLNRNETPLAVKASDSVRWKSFDQSMTGTAFSYFIFLVKSFMVFNSFKVSQSCPWKSS